MSNKVIGAKNQQATLQKNHDNLFSKVEGKSSETIRQTPFARDEILAYLNGALHDASLAIVCSRKGLSGICASRWIMASHKTANYSRKDEDIVHTL